ncbi:hypothetical protein Tco_1171902, partial [Tanacetum coccineum]
MSSSGAPSTPSYSAGHSTPPSYSSGPSTPPSYSSGPSTPTNYSLRSSRNRECSNCKHLRGKISVLKATMEMHIKLSHLGTLGHFEPWPPPREEESSYNFVLKPFHSHGFTLRLFHGFQDTIKGSP